MKNGKDRKGKFIAVANMKGGVGKTTTVVSLAETLAAEDPGAPVLVVDLDPQASASVCIAGDADLEKLIRADRTIEGFLEARLIKQERPQLEPLIRSRISAVSHHGQQLDLSLLPCGPHLRSVEREVLYQLTSRKMDMNAIDGQIWQVFLKDFAELRKTYEYIIFDCAPGISPVTEAAIRMADLVVVPTIPDYLSVYGLNAFHGSIWANRGGSQRRPKSRPHILITRLQNTKQHKKIMEDLVARVQNGATDYRLFEISIPQSAALADGIIMPGTPTFVQKYTSQIISQTLQPLVHEIKGFLHGSYDR